MVRPLHRGSEIEIGLLWNYKAVPSGIAFQVLVKYRTSFDRNVSFERGSGTDRKVGEIFAVEI